MYGAVVAGVVVYAVWQYRWNNRPRADVVERQERAQSPPATASASSAGVSTDYLVASLCIVSGTQISIDTKLVDIEHHRDGRADTSVDLVLAIKCVWGFSSREFGCAIAGTRLLTAKEGYPARTNTSLSANGLEGTAGKPEGGLVGIVPTDVARQAFRADADASSRPTSQDSEPWKPEAIRQFRTAFEEDFDSLSDDAFVIEDQRLFYYLVDPTAHRIIHYWPTKPFSQLWKRGESVCYDNVDQWLAATTGRSAR
jgi:hypothetical protein